MFNIIRYVLESIMTADLSLIPLNQAHKRIHAAAMKLFTERGVTKVSISELAAAAGMARGTIYSHVPDVDRLFEEVAGQLAREMTERVVAGFAGISDPAQRLAIGDTVVSGERVDVKIGNAMPLSALPVGTIVHNIEMKPGKGGQVARSAGTYAQYLGRDAGYALMRLNSSEVRKIPLTCMATVGAVSNPDHMNEVIGKAGRNVWKGKRPSVRGTAMNPIDHPHGGGEGRTKGGRHPVTPWGKPTKGAKTRVNKRTTKFIVRTRKGKAQG